MKETNWNYIQGMFTQLVVVGIILLWNKQINFENMLGMLIGIIIFAFILHLIDKHKLTKN